MTVTIDGVSVTNADPTEARVHLLVDKLRGRGFRLTPQRLAIVRAMVANPHHPDVDTVFRELVPLYPMMSLATVYKTVEVLKALGEVLELGFGNMPNHYDARIPDPHPHLICTRCGRIDDIDIGDVVALATSVEAQTGYHGIQPRLEFYGRCPECRSTLTD